MRTVNQNGGTSHAVGIFSDHATFRSPRHDDREPLRRLLIETDVFTTEEIGIALELVDIVLERPGQRDYTICIYGDENDVLGYYCIGPTPATEGTFDLYWIAVKRSEHGKGIGGALMGHAENWAKSRGGRLVIAQTSSQPKYENTRRFYRSHGYAELSRIPEYYRVGDDLVVFGKYLSTI